MKLRLQIDVAYDCNGATEEELRALLERIASSAAAAGGFTGTTPAEVLQWQASVTQLSVEADAPSVPASLADEFGYWEEHPRVSVSDWQFEVANGDTRCGYWDFVGRQLEALED
jgi:hypothetical protein